MAILDIFKRKQQTANESNTLFGQTALGNNIVRNAGSPPQAQSSQLLYVTTSSVSDSGRIVDMSVLSRNSTIMSCVGIIGRALSQLPIKIMAYDDNGKLVDEINNPDIGSRDKIKAKQVLSLLQNPNKLNWIFLKSEQLIQIIQMDSVSPSLKIVKFILLRVYLVLKRSKKFSEIISNMNY